MLCSTLQRVGSRSVTSRGEWLFGNAPHYSNANLHPADHASALDWEGLRALDRAPGTTPFHRVGWLASQLEGRVSAEQLRWLGVGRMQVKRWVERGQLHLVLPGVYAVGHTAPSFRADLTAALLYAGPGAELSHHTCMWWFSLTGRHPRTIEVTTPRRCQSQPGIRVFDRRRRQRVWLDRLPVTAPIDGLLDVATQASVDQVRYLLSQIEYRRLATLPEVEAALGPGRRGSLVVRRALTRHMPQLARTKSPHEIDLLFVCEDEDVPLPLVNHPLLGFTVDAVWLKERVVVEIDGEGGHGRASQRERDRQRDLILRQHGFLVLRYTGYQLKTQPRAIADDIRAALARSVTQAA